MLPLLVRYSVVRSSSTVGSPSVFQQKPCSFMVAPLAVTVLRPKATVAPIGTKGLVTTVGTLPVAFSSLHCSVAFSKALAASVIPSVSLPSIRAVAASTASVR